MSFACCVGSGSRLQPDFACSWLRRRSGQSFGVGPRFSFVSGELDSDGRSIFRCMLRLRTSDKRPLTVAGLPQPPQRKPESAHQGLPIQASFLSIRCGGMAPYVVGALVVPTECRSGRERTSC